MARSTTNMDRPLALVICDRREDTSRMASMGLAELLLRRWDLAASAGVMRTNVEDTIRRQIPGELGLVVQLNPNHLKSKRPVDKQLLSPPSVPPPKTSGFNFTKAKRPEFLCGLRFIDDDDQRLPAVEAVEMRDNDTARDEAKHFVLVNVAPLVHGHLLFVLDMDFVQPQKMARVFLQYALSISQAIHREDFALGFNSAGAWSSVNHFHLQGYFFPQQGTLTNFPVAAQQRQELFRCNGAIVKSLPAWKTSCYAIEPEHEHEAVSVVEAVWALLELLHAEGIPHNLLVVGTVVFVFPRQTQCENGVGFFTDGVSERGVDPVTVGRLRVAIAELSGLVIAGDHIAYEQLTEELFARIIQEEVSLPPHDEAKLSAAWKAKIGYRAC